MHDDTVDLLIKCACVLFCIIIFLSINLMQALHSFQVPAWTLKTQFNCSGWRVKGTTWWGMRELCWGGGGCGGGLICVHTNPGSKTRGKEKIKELLSGRCVITFHVHFQNYDANLEIVLHLCLPVWSNLQAAPSACLLILKRFTWLEHTGGR